MTTKRTHGPCTCGENDPPGHKETCPVYRRGTCTCTPTYDPVMMRHTVVSHQPDCSSLYPAQKEPDALTRLVRHLRDHSEGDDEFTDIALSLISEAREEQRKARNEALTQAAKVARAAAEHGCDPYAQCTCNWESKLDGVEGSILYLKDSEP